jgi:hypothetical protein
MSIVRQRPRAGGGRRAGGVAAGAAGIFLVFRDNYWAMVILTLDAE